MKPYKQQTISSEVRPHKNIRVLKVFGIAFILTFTCGTVLAIDLYKHVPLNDSEPSKVISFDNNKETVIQLNENHNSFSFDKKNTNSNKETIDIDIIHIQSFGEKMAFGKFEAIYNEYYKEINENQPVTAQIIMNKIKLPALGLNLIP